MGEVKAERGTYIIWRNCSLWNTCRTWGPMPASCGLDAMIWSTIAGLDMRVDICWRKAGLLHMPCI